MRIDFARVLRVGLPFLLMGVSATTFAVSPEDLERGKMLFEKTWRQGNPEMGSDGLGPLFNGNSCVVCHNQGGVGGGGDSRFNAMSLSIESVDYGFGLLPGGPETKNIAVDLVNQFFPGFFQPDGSFINTQTLPHHALFSGVSTERQRILSQLNASFDEAGGPSSVEDSRLASASPLIFRGEQDIYSVLIRANVFQRNTTSLFGAGQIDEISDRAILNQVRIQESHPEVSGRPSQLRDGSIGRFGWRANVSRLVQFVDRACANELGLETKRLPQPADPTRPAYRNPALDIADSDIESMSHFISKLPPPIRQFSSDAVATSDVHRGESLFASIGCAVCHVPQLESVSGLYSDLLLHDMGPNLYDFAAAEPYVIQSRLVSQLRKESNYVFVAYYGAPFRVDASEAFQNMTSPRASSATSDFVSLKYGHELVPVSTKIQVARSTSEVFRQHLGFERQLQPTNTTQEWRTPPLWGVRDSAPYMHDGRAETLLEAIAMHDGESAGIRDRFLQLSLSDRRTIIAFLNTLVAPPNVPQVPM